MKFLSSLSRRREKLLLPDASVDIARATFSVRDDRLSPNDSFDPETAAGPVYASKAASTLVLPNELLLEIVEYLPGQDLKNCRLVSKYLRDLTTRALFSKMRFALSPPRNYSYCPDHGFWYVAGTKRTGCDVCSAPATEQNYRIRNPFVDPVIDYLSRDSDLLRLMPLARELRIELLPITPPQWVSFEKELASFAAEALPLLILSAERLKVVHLNASLDQSLYQTLPFFLSRVCDLCSEGREDVDLHVSLRVSYWQGLMEALGGLRCITSLEVKGADRQKVHRDRVQEMLNNVIKNSPKMRLSPGQLQSS